MRLPYCLAGLVLFWVLPTTWAAVCEDVPAALADSDVELLRGQKTFPTQKSPDAYAQNELKDVIAAVRNKVPQVSSRVLTGILDHALENGIQHGGINGSSTVQWSVIERNGKIVITLLNDRNHPLPRTLSNTVFLPTSPDIRVPEEERDLERGNLGLATRIMAKSLRDLYGRTPVTTPPSIEWQEIDSGGPKIKFTLTVPLVTAPAPMAAPQFYSPFSR